MSTTRFIQLIAFVIGWMLMAPPALVTAEVNPHAMFMVTAGTIFFIASIVIGLVGLTDDN